MLEVLAIVISLALLIYLAYKGWSVVLVAPVLATVGVVLTGLFMGQPGSIHIMATYTEVFMKALGGYVKSYFPFFMLGAIFGTVMDYSGSAKSIANWIFAHLGRGKEVLAVVVACSLLTYGGVSMFVVVFAIYPIGAILFRKADIPKRFLPASIAAGAFCFTINAMAKGEGYGDHANEKLANIEDDKLPSFGTALIPIIVVIGLNLILSKGVYIEAQLQRPTHTLRIRIPMLQSSLP